MSAPGHEAAEHSLLLPLGATARRRLSTLLAVEVALLLCLSLGRSAVYSLLSIVERLTRHVALDQQTSQLNTAATPDRAWLSFLYQFAEVTFLPVAALLAVYLVRMVAEPAIGWRRAMGLHLDARRDLLWGLAFFAAIGIPGLGIYVGARELGLNTTVQAANLGEHWWTVPALVASAAANAVLEEVVMVGYLFTRLRQVRWRPWQILLFSAVVRGAYHLYQAFGGFVGNLLMGLVFGSWFLRTRRLWPLVGAHFLLDVASFVGYALLAGHVAWL